MGALTLAALAVACLADASPAAANSFDGTAVAGFLNFNTGPSQTSNYFDPTFVNGPPALGVITGENTTSNIVVISETATEFGVVTFNGPAASVDIFSVANNGAPDTIFLRMFIQAPQQTPNLIFTFVDTAFIGQTLSLDSAVFQGSGTPLPQAPFIVSSNGAIEIGVASVGTGNYTELFQFTPAQITVTPLPAALPLFATGLGALCLLARRRKRKGTVAIIA